MRSNKGRYLLKTPEGLKSFDGVKKVRSNYNYKFRFKETDETRTVTANHQFAVGRSRAGKILRRAYNIRVGHRLGKNLTVAGVEVIDDELEFYDFINIRSKNHIYSDTQGIVHHNCDEMAWIEDKKIKGFLDSSMPALSSGKDVTIAFISTPNGFNTFYKYAKDAKGLKPSDNIVNEDKNGFVYLEYDYTCVPGRDEAWYEQKVAEEGIIQAQRNYKVKFLGSAKTLVSAEKLMEIENNCKKPIDFYDQAHHDFKIFEYPIYGDPNIIYTIGCDSSKISSTSKTNSDEFSIQVIKIDLKQRKMEQVASLKTREMHYTESAAILDSIGRYYNYGWVLIENNSEGQGIANDLFNIYEYENVYASSKRNDVFGFRTTKTSRSIGVGNLAKLLRLNVLKLNDIDTVKDLHTFVKDSRGIFRAQTPEDHDDTIFALIAALYWLQDDTSQEIEITIYDFLNKDIELVDLTITTNIKGDEGDEDLAGMFFASGGV